MYLKKNQMRKKKTESITNNRNSEEISKGGIPVKRKIISEGRSKMQEEILSLKMTNTGVTVNKHQPYNLITRKKRLHFKAFKKAK